MFNLFKKNKTQQEQINAIIDEMTLYGQPFRYFIENMEQDDRILQIQMRIFEGDDTAQLERQYAVLQQKLSSVGIDEVNLNVIISSTDPKPADATSATSQAGVQTHNPKTSASASAKALHQNSIPVHQTESKPAKPAPKQSDLTAHPRIANIVAVASGKGGVGKSTTTVNLALALQKLGKKVGILDADIYGPSIPAMLGVSGVKPAVENDQFVPIDANGIAILSIGNLLDGDSTPVAWRGIKATGALMQLYGQTNWPMLDYLLIDMPPGTGDIQLSISQKIPVSGAVIVTTPQHIALLDAQKGIEMFVKTQIPVLGVVENMATHICSNCGHEEAIFGSGGGDMMASQYQVPLLGQLPLVATIRQQMDTGKPQTLQNGEIGEHYLHIAQKIDASIGQFQKKSTQRFF